MKTTCTSSICEIKNLGLSIAVKDLEATSQWYQTQLGFKEVLKKDFLEYGTRIVFLERNGVRIELIEDGKWQPILRLDPPQHTSIQGVSQITFRVDSIEEVVKEVKNRSIEVKDINFKEFFIRDNEGNIIQFVETPFRYDGDVK